MYDRSTRKGLELKRQIKAAGLTEKQARQLVHATCPDWHTERRIDKWFAAAGLFEYTAELVKVYAHGGLYREITEISQHGQLIY